MRMSEIANASINTFGTASPKANVSPSEESVFVLSSGQLQEIISRAIQPLQDEVSQLNVAVIRQQEDIASLKSTENLNFSDIRDLYTAIDEIDQRQQIKPQPLQKDRGEILRALLAANGGKMLAKEARKRMHISESRFSELIKKCNFLEIKPMHNDRRKHILILKSKLLPRK